MTRTVEDGRAFLRRSDKKYDLILLAQTDSLTLLSTTGNIRLESFLFTKEAFADIRDHLKPGGLMVMYNLYWQDWAVDRLGLDARRHLRAAADHRALRHGAVPRGGHGRRPGARRDRSGRPPGAEVMQVATPEAERDRRLAVPVPASSRDLAAVHRRAS